MKKFDKKPVDTPITASEPQKPERIELKKGNDWFPRTFIACFLVVLFLFPVLWFWGIGPGINYENRTLAKMPTFKDMFLNYTDFSKKFDEYYNDNFPLKSGFVSAYSYTNYKLFSTSIMPNVTTVGRNGWLFYEDYGTRSAVSGDMHFDEATLKNIYDGIEAKSQALKALGKEYIVYIAPEKQMIYSEYDKLKVGSYTAADQVVDYLLENNCSASILYGKDYLIANKDKKNISYYKYDTHWNRYGSYYGYRQIMETLAPKLNKEVSIAQPNGVAYEKYNSADLATTLFLTDKLTENSPYMTFEDTVHITYEVQDEILTKATSSSGKDLKLFIYGDSFSQARFWAEYFGQSASEINFLHNRNNFETLLKYVGDCDAVIEECVQRVPTTLANH